MKFLLAKKLGMTTIYGEGAANNVTLLEVGANVVKSLRTQEKDGYSAIQVGMDKAVKGKNTTYQAIGEFRMDSIEGFEAGKEIPIDQFKPGDKVTIQSISKGKGYQGVVKRHGFAGAPASHGHRHDLRAPGSIGSAFPEHVMKGKKMAGRMGSISVTTKNIKVVQVDGGKRIIAVKGTVPGTAGSVVKIIGK